MPYINELFTAYHQRCLERTRILRIVDTNRRTNIEIGALDIEGKHPRPWTTDIKEVDFGDYENIDRDHQEDNERNS